MAWPSFGRNHGKYLDSIRQYSTAELRLQDNSSVGNGVGLSIWAVADTVNIYVT